MSPKAMASQSLPVPADTRVLSTNSTLGTGTLAKASPRLWSLFSVVLGETQGEQALSVLLWLTAVSQVGATDF